jgi:hypothetical protein
MTNGEYIAELRHEANFRCGWGFLVGFACALAVVGVFALTFGAVTLAGMLGAVALLLGIWAATLAAARMRHWRRAMFSTGESQ